MILLFPAIISLLNFVCSESISNASPINSIKLKDTPVLPSSTERTESTLLLANHISEQSLRVLHRHLSIALPWLYFMAVNMNLPNLPKFINSVLNKGVTKVSGKSQIVYGNLSGLDAMFTFLSVNAIGCLSDVYGRKPFMMYSAMGLGTSFFICSLAASSRPWMFYISGCLDGLSSCMFSQSQAYISDVSKSQGENLSVSLSQFQGLAIGLAFMFGIPLGGYLGSHYGLKAPLYCSSALCLLCFFSIFLFLPESLSQSDRKSSSRLDQMNPIGAVNLFLRSRKLSLLAMVYFLLNIAQAGIQVVWINYLQHAFDWPAHISAFSLAIVGLTVAVLPRFFIPVLGASEAIRYGLFLHALSLIALALTSSKVLLFCIMFMFALGASTLPTLLGYIADQVGPEEVGAVQGAAETVRTLATAISYPLTSRVFSHYISDGRSFPQASLLFASTFSLTAFFLYSICKI